MSETVDSSSMLYHVHTYSTCKIPYILQSSLHVMKFIPIVYIIFSCVPNCMTLVLDICCCYVSYIGNVYIAVYLIPMLSKLCI